MSQIDWAAFDHHSTEWMADPGPAYGEARTRCPVVRSDQHGGFWLVTRYGDVDAVARDWTRFSSASGIAIPAALDTRVVPQEADPPQHTEVRDQLTPWFSPGAVGGMEPLVKALAGELLDRAGSEEFDVALDFAIPLASLTMLRLLGFAESAEPSLQRDIGLLSPMARPTETRRSSPIPTTSSSIGPTTAISPLEAASIGVSAAIWPVWNCGSGSGSSSNASRTTNSKARRFGDSAKTVASARYRSRPGPWFETRPVITRPS